MDRQRFPKGSRCINRILGSERRAAGVERLRDPPVAVFQPRSTDPQRGFDRQTSLRLDSAASRAWRNRGYLVKAREQEEREQFAKRVVGTRATGASSSCLFWSRRSLHFPHYSWSSVCGSVRYFLRIVLQDAHAHDVVRPMHMLNIRATPITSPTEFNRM